jgi:hypothetical protein
VNRNRIQTIGTDGISDPYNNSNEFAVLANDFVAKSRNGESAKEPTRYIAVDYDEWREGYVASQDREHVSRYGRTLIASGIGEATSVSDNPPTELMGSMGIRPVLSDKGAKFSRSAKSK